MPPLPVPLPAIGDLFEASWGSYVYRGAPPRDGRLALIAVGSPGTYVLVALDRLWIDYRPTGREIRPGTRLVEIGRTRLTLGAVRPPTNSAGMVPGELGGGTFTSVPGRETLYWIPCRTYATELLEGVPAILPDGTEEHPARLPKSMPHAFFIASSLKFSLCCDACRTPVRADPVVSADRETAVASVAVFAPQDPPPSPPAIAPPDDPRDSVADFSRPPAREVDQRRVKPTDLYRPNDVDAERSEYWSERAAIFEYMGDFDRWISEQMALEETLYATKQGWIR